MQIHPPLTVIQQYILPVWNSLNERDRTSLSVLEQGVLYLGLIIGVFISSSLGQVELGLSQPLSMLAAFIATPAFYERLGMTAHPSLLVRFALFVQQGVFWHVVCTLVD